MACSDSRVGSKIVFWNNATIVKSDFFSGLHALQLYGMTLPRIAFVGNVAAPSLLQEVLSVSMWAQIQPIPLSQNGFCVHCYAKDPSYGPGEVQGVLQVHYCPSFVMLQYIECRTCCVPHNLNLPSSTWQSQKGSLSCSAYSAVTKRTQA
mmetsp:Transcript_133158/g.230880  ORF Transcript_133158/g.230880 Transcript_133158/m.230880 type:complete len:150 (-) Transcript_133158:126-575(-)